MKLLASAIAASIIPFIAAPALAQARTPVRTEPEFVKFPVDICSNLGMTISEDEIYCDNFPDENLASFGTSGFTEDGYRIVVASPEQNSDNQFIFIYANGVLLLTARYGEAGLEEISEGSRSFLAEFIPEINHLQNRLVELQQTEG